MLFMAPAVVPLCLLSAWALAWLASVKTNPLRRTAQPPAGAPWGRPPAVAVFALGIVLVNFIVIYTHYQRVTPEARLHGARITEPVMVASLAEERPELKLPADARFLLLGEARGLYFPAGTRYATVFDAHPLAETADLDDAQLREKLRELDVTHIYVNWWEVRRLARSYGFPAELSRDLLRGLDNAEPTLSLPILDRLEAMGAKRFDVFPPAPKNDTKAQPRWPIKSIYVLPLPDGPATTPAAKPATSTTGAPGN